MTIDRVWIVIGFIEHLQNVTICNYDSLTELYTPKITVTTVFPSRCSVAACNGGLPRTLGSRIVPDLSYSNSRLTKPPTSWLHSNDWLPDWLQLKVKVTLRLAVGQSVSKSWCRAPSGAHGQIFITVWQLRSCFCGGPYLTRGEVCLLYMLLILVSAVFLGSESLGTRDHIVLSQIWDFSFRRLLRLAGSRWRYSTWPYCTVSDLRLPFSSPPTTRRVMVEVFDPASTRVGCKKPKSHCNWRSVNH
jgi:hypothetical protein